MNTNKYQDDTNERTAYAGQMEYDIKHRTGILHITVDALEIANRSNDWKRLAMYDENSSVVLFDGSLMDGEHK